MVTLSRIYTKTGDCGKTRLGNNAQVPKTDARLEAYGCVDELNAVLGLALGSDIEEEHGALLRRVQNDLFDLGADLCCPEEEGEKEGRALRLRVQAVQVEGLEQAIDRLNQGLPPLRSFVLPGGSPLAAWLHLARTVCRRAERRAWALAEREQVNQQALIYLNRLSDLFFVMARAVNKGGEQDVLWEPGKGQREGA